MEIRRIIAFGLFGLILLLPTISEAQRVGVGVTTGSIRVDELLNPGGTYELPAMGVMNTGEVTTRYIMDVTYHTDQKELRPEKDWITFSPSEFYLDPGESQAVGLTVTLPVRTVPGDYFAYLEASPLREDVPGTRIGVAAATRLYFTVAPANIFQGMYYKTASFMTKYAPWTWVVLALILVAVVVAILRRFISIDIKPRSKRVE